MKPIRTALVYAAVVVVLLGLLMLAFRDRAAESVPAVDATQPIRTLDAPEVEPAAETTGVGLERQAADSCGPNERAAMPAQSTTAPDEISSFDASEARGRLLSSRDPEHLGAAALLADNDVERVDHITRALATGRDNVTLVWTAVQICAEAIDEVSCPMQEWEHRLLEVDGGNSEAWVRMAVSRLARGERALALEAMQRAAVSAETRTYWPETIEMVERALAAAGGYSFSDRIDIAFGIAAASLPRYETYVSMCRTQSESSPVWAEACLRYGELAERQDITHIGRAIAQEIQVAALEAIGDDEALEDVAARKQEARIARAASAERGGTADALIIGNPAYFSLYLATLRESGEAAARDFLQEEADRLARELDARNCRRTDADR